MLNKLVDAILVYISVAEFVDVSVLHIIIIDPNILPS